MAGNTPNSSGNFPAGSQGAISLGSLPSAQTGEKQNKLAASHTAPPDPTKNSLTWGSMLDSPPPRHVPPRRKEVPGRVGTGPPASTQSGNNAQPPYGSSGSNAGGTQATSEDLPRLGHQAMPSRNDEPEFGYISQSRPGSTTSSVQRDRDVQASAVPVTSPEPPYGQTRAGSRPHRPSYLASSSGANPPSQENTEEVTNGTRIESAPQPYEPVLRQQPSNVPRDNPKSGIQTKAQQVTYERTKLKGYGWVWWWAFSGSGDWKFRWKWPNLVREPRWKYPQNRQYRHKDSLTRELEGNGLPLDDRYLSPVDGHLARLVVQAVDPVYNGPYNCTWRRTFIRNMAPLPVRMALWPHMDKSLKNFGFVDFIKFSFWWSISCAGLLCTTGFPVIHQGQIRNGGWYDPFPYKFWGYAKSARNASELREVDGDEMKPLLVDEESEPEDQTNSTNVRRVDNRKRANNTMTKRLLDPKFLNFLKKAEDKDAMGGQNRLSVKFWRSKHPEEALTYIVLVYTTQQFAHTLADAPNTQHPDVDVLRFIGEKAARSAGVKAFWLAANCIDPNDESNEVYRISDVLRGASAVVIAVGQPFAYGLDRLLATNDLLRQWGERAWTFPEILLAPQGRPIKVWTRNEEQFPYGLEDIEIPKNQFAAQVWQDPYVSRQLIDNFEGNLRLSNLELTTLALKCLHNRKTSIKWEGDMSYALMGLLRLRPEVKTNDSAFQAFARLSLANDSDKLLERLICTLPRYLEQPWHDMDDAWGVNLWDIYPECQVSGICEDDSVIIDGAYGAAIRWKSFGPVATFGSASWRRLFAQLAVHGSPHTAYVGFTLMIVGSVNAGESVLLAVGAVIFVYAIIMLSLSPILIRSLYGGKVYTTQAWFFGFEGYADLETIENQIWGGRERYFGPTEERLSWSPWGSPLSRHVEIAGECVGVDPVQGFPETQALVEAAKLDRTFGGQKIFTLVDTYTRTVTLFQAVRPPIAVLICGSEGGMQRAVGVSYDWPSQTLYRETVFRMETPILERMFRVPRCRFGFYRDKNNPKWAVEWHGKKPNSPV